MLRTVDFWPILGHSCAMTRRASLLLSVTLLFSSTASAADRALVAEGDYVARSNLGKPLAHWKVWHLRNGDYEVVEALAGPSHIVQAFYFDAQFLPSGFSLTIDTRPTIPATERGTLPFAVYPTIISCRYSTQDLSCETEDNGKKSAISIPAKQPYVLVPGEFYALDHTWLMTAIVRLTQHNHSDPPWSANTVDLCRHGNRKRNGQITTDDRVRSMDGKRTRSMGPDQALGAAGDVPGAGYQREREIRSRICHEQLQRIRVLAAFAINSPFLTSRQLGGCLSPPCALH